MDDHAWLTASEALTITPHEVHVWRASLDWDSTAVLPFVETLAGDELARAERFHSAVHRNRYIAARGILRTLLSRYLGTPPGDLTFTQNVHGKPALAPGREALNLRFNLSHSQDLALFAFAVGREVGVDVEFVRSSANEDRLAERFFSPDEVAALRALPQDAQREGFFRCWTRKEAYIKARGAGLSMGLATFTVPLSAYAGTLLPIACDDDSQTGRWWLCPLEPGPGCAGAVAAEGSDWRLALWNDVEAAK